MYLSSHIMLFKIMTIVIIVMVPVAGDMETTSVYSRL